MIITSLEPLSRWSTLGVGGAARWFCRVTDESSVCRALSWAGARGAPVHVLGGGSNVVFADDGFDGVVVRIDVRGVHVRREDGRVHYAVGAAEPWDEFVAATLADQCAGLECLSGIPGQVGGTPIQNVGAYGQDVSSTIVRVQVVDRHTRKVQTLSGGECGFGYRTSRFKQVDRNRFVIVRVEFALAVGVPATVTYPDVQAHLSRQGNAAPTLVDVREAVLSIRRRKGMVVEPGNQSSRSVGSFFLNPVIPTAHLQHLRRLEDGVPCYTVDERRVKVPAAWLIERAGFAKGSTRGPAGVSPFQAQAIVNCGGARAADVLALAADIKQAVWDRFQIMLVPEPEFVGFAQSEPLAWLRRSEPEPSRRGCAARG
ncbi:MAG: UDP-N-acetylmuramate dehydrogenase [Acidobacteriota bacterium]